MANVYWNGRWLSKLAKSIASKSSDHHRMKPYKAIITRNSIQVSNDGIQETLLNFSVERIQEVEATAWQCTC